METVVRSLALLSPIVLLWHFLAGRSSTLYFLLFTITFFSIGLDCASPYILVFSPLLMLSIFIIRQEIKGKTTEATKNDFVKDAVYDRRLFIISTFVPFAIIVFWYLYFLPELLDTLPLLTVDTPVNEYSLHEVINDILMNPEAVFMVPVTSAMFIFAIIRRYRQK